MASITKQSNNTYKVAVSVVVNGKRKRLTKSGFISKADANRWGYEQETKKKDLVKSFNSNLFSTDFWNWYETFKEPTLKTTSKLWYKTTRNVIVKYLPDIKTRDLTTFIVQEMINEFAKTHVKSSITHVKNNISSFIRFAVDNGMLERDFTRSLVVSSNRQSKDKELKYLDQDEIDKLTVEIEKTHSTSNAMIYTALLTGMRYAEIAALKRSDFDFKQHLVNVNKNYVLLDKNVSTTKTRTSERVISIPDNLIKYLSDFKGGDKYFFEFEGEPITSNGVNKQLRRLLKNAGIKKQMTFHGLRHTHASYLLSNNVDVQYVSERLGHSDIKITLGTYAHLFKHKRESENQKALNLLQKI